MVTYQINEMVIRLEIILACEKRAWCNTRDGLIHLQNASLKKKIFKKVFEQFEYVGRSQ